MRERGAGGVKQRNTGEGNEWKKQKEQGVARRGGAVQLWRGTQTGEEHKYTRGKQSKRHHKNSEGTQNTNTDKVK